MGLGSDSAERYNIKNALREMSQEDFSDFLKDFSGGGGIDSLVARLPGCNRDDISDILDNFNEYTDEEARSVIDVILNSPDFKQGLHEYDGSFTFVASPRLVASVVGLYTKYVIKIYVSEELARLTAIRFCLIKAAYENIPVNIVSNDYFPENGFDSKIVAYLKKRYRPLDKNKPHILIHNSNNKGNAGAIIRNATAFGYTDFALVDTEYSIFHPRVVKTCRGLIYRVNCMEYDTMEDYLKDNPDRVLYPFALDSSITLDEAVAKGIPKNSTLIFGNESMGLPKEISSMGTAVRIPIKEYVDSLNVSAAASVAIYVFSKATDI